jgi:hypothetical protein
MSASAASVEITARRIVEFEPPLASVTVYTFFQGHSIQSTHFGYPEAAALAGGFKLYCKSVALM